MEIRQDKQMEIRKKVEGLLAGLCQGLYEREEAVKMALLSAIAGESIFLLGPPGVGKSLIARRLKYAFSDGISFEYLMSRFSTPDEIFGPISIQKLKEEDKYERKTERYLPGANIVFLDEIWKAGPAIQNALLTILNEKIYRNGDQDMKVNVRGIITASNELPPKEESFGPIWDRFLIRMQMGNIRDYKKFLDMIVDTKDVYENDIPEEFQISEMDLREWEELINAIEIPSEVLNTIQMVKFQLEEFNKQANNAEQPILIYDRRWKKMVRLLRTSAFLNGRKEVDLMDCFLMMHCLWNEVDHIQAVQQIVGTTLREHGYSLAINLNMLRKEVNEFEADVEQETKVNHSVAEEQLKPIQEEYYELLKTDNKFEGKLIAIKDFKALEMDTHKVVNLFDDELNLVNRLNASKASDEFVVNINFSSQDTAYTLKTVKTEKAEVIYKKAHTLVEKFWDEKYEKLSAYIRQQQEKINADSPQALNHLAENLFVDASLSKIIEQNMNELKHSLRELGLRLEKVQFGYKNVK